MKLKLLFCLFILNSVTARAEYPQDSILEAREIIRSYCQDFQYDSYASEAMYFGVEVPGIGQWTIEVTGQKKGENWEVLWLEASPSRPTFVYLIEFNTLKAIHEGQMNALTAQGKAFSGDYTPMSVKNMEGFKPSPEEDAKINPFSFHFWTRGYPEVIPFGEGMTRKAHGSNFVIFYYEKGIRTAWYRILPGERVRDNAREQAAPFPMMAVSIKGTIQGEVDGKRVTYKAGNTIFIPPNVSHKWWNDSDEVVEVVLIMFGKGA